MTMGASPTRVAIVTNIPAPYRLPVYESLATEPQITLKVFFCSGREPDREWNLRESNFDQFHLRERFISYSGRFIHINPDVWGALRSFSPEVVITTGFNPTHLIAYLYARVHGVRHIAMTDGTYESEKRLSSIHRWIRRQVYANSRTFIGASDGSADLFKSYGIDSKRIFKSHLCVDNSAFIQFVPSEKRFDFIFCGRFVEIKSPLFAIEVAHEVAKRLGRRVSIVFVGSGEMEQAMRDAARSVEDNVEVVFAGFARQEELPQLYGSARIFVFPTQWDPWGVVANEACAAGLPVLVSPIAGCAGELVRDGQNGFVMPLDIHQWTNAAVRLLSHSNFYQAMSARSLELVKEYSYKNAALGIANAVKISLEDETLGSPPLVNQRRVVVIQRRMTHYRVAFFECLRQQLAERDIELVLAYGEGTPDEQRKNDGGDIAWANKLQTHYLWNGRICYQPLGMVSHAASMIVVTLENKLICNLWHQFSPAPYKVALWGHGGNLQGKASSWRERFKRHVARRADWWFGYTEHSRSLIAQSGFPEDRVTVLNNAIDITEMRNQFDNIESTDIARWRAANGLADGPVGVFLGSFYEEKRIDFLLSAAREIREQVPGFELLLVGAGPQKSLVDAFCKEHAWAHSAGMLKGQDKVMALASATVMLNPGLVGLGILDSFVCEVPMVTTDCGLHSPEIVYLQSGINGLMTRNTLDDYVHACVALVASPSQLAALKAGCKGSAKTYTVENMARNFADGVEQCLQSPNHRAKARL